MAITIDDFSKIWASTSPLTPYEFSESNYKEGWNFIGGTPPSRQMWDFLQKNNDEKMQYLANNYLPLSGGTMTGQLTLDSRSTMFTSKYATLQNNYSDNGGYIAINGGNGDDGGSRLVLYGQNYNGSAADGSFYIRAKNGNLSKVLDGRTNGSLTWDGKEVVTKKDENISSQVTVTTNNGTVSEINFHKVGNVVTGRFAITISTAVNVGDTISGTINGAPADVSPSGAVGYVGEAALVMALNGLNYNIRVIGANLSAGRAFAIQFMYVTVS